MKFKKFATAVILSMVLTATAYASEKVNVFVNDGSAMESGNYKAFTVSNVTNGYENEYSWKVYEVEAPSVIDDISEHKEEFYVLEFSDFEKYFLNDYVPEEISKASLKAVDGKISLNEEGKYGMYFSNGAYEYICVFDVKAAPVVKEPEAPAVPVKPVILPETANAVPTDSKVVVNGESVAFDAYNINGNNYFKLRDVAKVVSGSEKQFAVTWDGEKNSINLISGKPYDAVGTELAKGDGKSKTATLNTSKIYKDGVEAELRAYTINDNNYFKLRDLGRVFDFGIGWDASNNCITVNTSEGYTE